MTTDVAETKRKAEAGDSAAQFTLADIFAGQSRPADALVWYRKAGEQGRIDAIHRIGQILLFGAAGLPSDKSVRADAATGIRFVFWAATNRYIAAYYDMHRAYRDGLGVHKDRVQAFAWLQLDVASKFSPITASMHQSELNKLALDLDLPAIETGKRFAAQYNAGQWPKLNPVAQQSSNAVRPGHGNSGTSVSEPVLKLNGLLLGTNPMAIINGKTVEEGSIATIPLKARSVTLKCIKIETNSVLIHLEGEERPRRLYRN